MSWIERGINKLRDEAASLRNPPPPPQQPPQGPPSPPPPIPSRPAAERAQWTQAGAPQPTPDNELFFQSFEWHTKSDPPKPHETHSRESHWGRLARILPGLAELGVSSLWLPPGCKANNPSGNGYDCYDLWDLGEFDQKWTRSTKWGSREEVRDLVVVAGGRGVELIWDAVLNHKTAGDAVEETWAVEVDRDDRRIEICTPKKIEAWLKYEFSGREKEGMKYSPLKWRAEHFSGTDWDQRAKRNAIYKLIDDPATYLKPKEEQLPMPSKPQLGFNRFQRFAGAINEAKNALSNKQVAQARPGKGWLEDVDKMFGNYDYLIFSNVYYLHPEVRSDVLNWGQWMIEETGISGFRLDAAQHMSWNFTREWISNVQAASWRKNGRPAFVVGEVLSGEVGRLLRWLDFVTPSGCGHATAWAFDTPLVYSFSRVSEDVRRGSKNADLRTLLSGAGNPEKTALSSIRPHQAVTFVTNHDTQPGQSSFTPMDASIKSLFYAFILLRREGQPCVFWGDLYGTLGDKAGGPACRAPSVVDPTVQNGAGNGSSTSSRSLLPSLMMARKRFAYGSQQDYFDSMSCIGWTRSGTYDRPGCVVVMSIGPLSKWTIKKMAAGRPGEKWVDVLSEREGRPEIIIDDKGFGIFACRGRSVSVYVREDYEAGLFPVPFDHDVYRQ